MTSSAIAVRHNIEVAHRLHLLPGKCQAIHGHSMWIRLGLTGMVDQQGVMQGWDFGVIKQKFRGYLDDRYDHRLLLDRDDPISGVPLPGLRLTAGQPTTENIARWVGEWAAATFGVPGSVTVRETHVNEASWCW